MRFRAGKIAALSMKTKTALAVSIVFLLFVSALAAISLRYFEKHFEETVFTQQTALATALVQSVDSKLILARDALATLAQDLPPDLLRDSDKAQAFLERQRALLSIFDNGLLLITEEGRVFAEAPFIPGGRGRDVSALDVFKGASASGKPYISKPFISVRAKGRPVLSMSVPLFDRNGAKIGRLHGSVELLGKNFLVELLDVKIGGSGYLYLTTADRTIILHSNRERIMTKAPPSGLNLLYDRAVDGYEGSGRTVTSLGLETLVTFRRLQSTNWILSVNYPKAEAYAPFYQAQRIFIWVIATGTAAVLLLVWLLMRRFTAPLAAMTAHAEALPEKSGEARFLRPTARDEIGTLGRAFDRMVGELDAKEHSLREINATLEARVSDRTARLAAANAELESALATLKRAQRDLVEADKLASLGSLVAGVAHELNTPIGNALTVASTLDEKSAQFARDAEGAALRRSLLTAYVSESRQAAALLMRSLLQAGQMIANFKQVAADQASAQRRGFDLAEVVGEVVSTLQPRFRKTPHRVEFSIAPGMHMDSYPGPLGQLISNLTINALVHAFDGVDAGTIKIAAAALDGERVSLTVSDNGRGITAEHLPRIFDPFFTTKLGKGGSGLGLNIAYNIVSGMLGGKIEVRSTVGQGTQFTIEIPRVAPVIAEAGDAA
jgi:signal transduction histidine kinase